VVSCPLLRAAAGLRVFCPSKVRQFYFLSFFQGVGRLGQTFLRKLSRIQDLWFPFSYCLLDLPLAVSYTFLFIPPSPPLCSPPVCRFLLLRLYSKWQRWSPLVRLHFPAPSPLGFHPNYALHPFAFASLRWLSDGVSFRSGQVLRLWSFAILCSQSNSPPS